MERRDGRAVTVRRSAAPTHGPLRFLVTTASSSYQDLVSLGRRLYDRALIRREDEPITDPRGQSIGWLLDTRIPMLEAETFREVGAVLAERLAARGADQVVGFGFGAYAMVSAVLAAPGSTFRGGLVREQRKPHGRRRLVEGPLDPMRPVVLLDDILNSGRSALRAVALLRSAGFRVSGVATLFHFTWSGGRARLEAEGLWVDALLDLNLRTGPESSHDSP